MKKILIPLAIVLISLLIYSLRSAGGPYKDGVYEGRSHAIYSYEPYVGVVKLTVKDGWITEVDFKIVDTVKNELFDSNYERYMNGNELYIQQCRNDWKGVQAYPGVLLKNQELDKVDAVSGATWSYNMFSYSVRIALKNAKKK
jgi:major membrane immunogen (membrane-anchored lipoprotein)